MKKKALENTQRETIEMMTVDAENAEAVKTHNAKQVGNKVEPANLDTALN